MVARREVGSRLTLTRHDHVDRPGFDAHAAWAAGAWPSVAAAFDSTPRDAFYSHAVNADLGGMTVQFATGSARTLNRTADRAREDGNSSLVVGINADGVIEADAGGRPLRVLAGQVLLLDLAQPCRVAIPASRSIQLAVPRALATRYLGAVRRLHGRVIPVGAASLFVDHLRQLEDVIPSLAVAQGPRLAGVLLDLLAIGTRRDETAGATAREAGDIRDSGSIRAAIEASVVTPPISVAALCQKLGVSRSTLSRMFRGEGGVEAHLRNLRLARVREALLDPRNGERIGGLAQRWGFTDASHLTRAFRTRYGMTPSAMRAGVAVLDAHCR